MRRSKVTLLFSLTCCVACVQTSLPVRKSREGGRLYTGYCGVDFFMLSPYGPYNKPVFLALIPPSFTSLNPFVTFSDRCNPILAVTTGESMRIPGSTPTLSLKYRKSSHAKQEAHTKSNRLRMSEENFRTELSRITFYDFIIYSKL